MQKDQAKQLGARWDGENKVWYLDMEVISDLEPFLRWIVHIELEENDPTIKSNEFFIAKSVQSCWKCKKNTRVYSFYLEEYDSIHVHDDKVFWMQNDLPTIIEGVEFLNPEALEAMEVVTGSYSNDYSKFARSRYYMNHCENCKAKQGDFFLHCEPGNAFCPVTKDEVERITIYRG